MGKDIRKICIILGLVLLLEIPVFLLWNKIPGNGIINVVESTDYSNSSAETSVSAADETSEPIMTTSATAATEERVPSETIPARVSINTVPQFYQNDYPDELYGTGTVATSGSSMTALAMVASFMTDHLYYPDEMADMLAHFIGGNYQRLEYGSDLLQLNWKRAQNIHESLAAVQNGEIVILMLNSNNFFTWKEHYVVLTGINENGKIEVLDTDAENYEKEWLKQYYEDGFTQNELLRGYSCGWIYDKDAMPDDPFVYTPEPPAEVSRYPGLELTAEEKKLIADVICMEAGGEPFEGQQAVAEVILNRLKSGRFQSNIYNIIHAPDQFAAVPYLYQAQPNYTQYKAIEQAQYGPYILPEDVVFYAKFKVNDNYWGQIGSHYFCYSY